MTKILYDTGAIAKDLANERKDSKLTADDKLLAILKQVRALGIELHPAVARRAARALLRIGLGDVNGNAP